MVDLNQNLLIITLSENDLNTPIKRQMLSEYIFLNHWHNYVLFTRNLLKIKRGGKAYNANTKNKVTVVILISDQKDFRNEEITESFTRRNSNPNCVPNSFKAHKAKTYRVEKKLIDKSTIIVGGF